MASYEQEYTRTHSASWGRPGRNLTRQSHASGSTPNAHNQDQALLSNMYHIPCMAYLTYGYCPQNQACPLVHIDPRFATIQPSVTPYSYYTPTPYLIQPPLSNPSTGASPYYNMPVNVPTPYSVMYQHPQDSYSQSVTNSSIEKEILANTAALASLPRPSNTVPAPLQSTIQSDVSEHPFLSPIPEIQTPSSRRFSESDTKLRSPQGPDPQHKKSLLEKFRRTSLADINLHIMREPVETVVEEEEFEEALLYSDDSSDEEMDPEKIKRPSSTPPDYRRLEEEDGEVIEEWTTPPIHFGSPLGWSLPLELPVVYGMYPPSNGGDSIDAAVPSTPVLPMYQESAPVEDQTGNYRTTIHIPSAPSSHSHPPPSYEPAATPPLIPDVGEECLRDTERSRTIRKKVPLMSVDILKAQSLKPPNSSKMSHPVIHETKVVLQESSKPLSTNNTSVNPSQNSKGPIGATTPPQRIQHPLPSRPPTYQSQAPATSGSSATSNQLTVFPGGSRILSGGTRIGDVRSWQTKDELLENVDGGSCGNPRVWVSKPAPPPPTNLHPNLRSHTPTPTPTSTNTAAAATPTATTATTTTAHGAPNGSDQKQSKIPGSPASKHCHGGPVDLAGQSSSEQQRPRTRQSSSPNRTGAVPSQTKSPILNSKQKQIGSTTISSPSPTRLSQPQPKPNSSTNPVKHHYQQQHQHQQHTSNSPLLNCHHHQSKSDQQCGRRRSVHEEEESKGSSSDDETRKLVKAEVLNKSSGGRARKKSKKPAAVAPS